MAAGLGDHERGHGLTRVRVLDADDGRGGDAGMLEQRLLHLGGEDVEARDDDEVFGSVDDEEVAVVVDHGDVARAQPAVRRERRRSCLFVVPVAGEDVGAPHPDLPGVALERVLAFVVDQPDLDAGQRHADRALARLAAHE